MRFIHISACSRNLLLFIVVFCYGNIQYIHFNASFEAPLNCSQFGTFVNSAGMIFYYKILKYVYVRAAGVQDILMHSALVKTAKTDFQSGYASL